MSSSFEQDTTNKTMKANMIIFFILYIFENKQLPVSQQLLRHTIMATNQKLNRH
tara:strand:+ start:35807 stop:35968 length:162 start_codon:yes stop_codon:yes gene_type:complete